MSCCVVSYHVMSCHVILCHVVYRVMSCRVVLWRVRHTRACVSLEFDESFVLLRLFFSDLIYGKHEHLHLTWNHQRTDLYLAVACMIFTLGWVVFLVISTNESNSSQLSEKQWMMSSSKERFVQFKALSLDDSIRGLTVPLPQISSQWPS